METIDELIDRLRGTCNESFDLDDYNLEELEYLDECIFECTRCGWWYDIGDLGDCDVDELVCIECCDDD